MTVVLKRMAFVVASALLITLALKTWAAPSKRAAHLYASEEESTSGATARASRNERGARKPAATLSVLPLPSAVRFREVEGRGLLVKAWINETGPYTLAVDTGAGSTILSERVAQSAGVLAVGNRTAIGGLSGAGARTGREATLKSLSVGDRNNYLPSQSTVIVTNSLPQGLDGVLDPSASYWPLGYTIDFPAETISAFDPRSNPLRVEDAPRDGAVVPWIFEGATRRPFVRLDNGRNALIDTGSGFGLALSEMEAQSLGVIPRVRRRSSEVRDLAGGSVSAHRVTPLTVRIGPMALRNVPTDILYGVGAGAPILLGRDALRPFKLTFDPLNRLVQIAP